MHASGSLRTTCLTALALMAFAANSIFMRLALVGEGVDPASFTTVRVSGGAVALGLLVAIRRRRQSVEGVRDLPSAMLLTLYAVPVTYAYRQLSTGTGAVLLFAAVQATMIAGGWRRGERPPAAAWGGLIVALAGLVLLVAPGLEAPPPVASLLMASAGVAWGLYSLRGRGTVDPVEAAASSFAWALPASLLVSLLTLHSFHVSPRGLALAAVSGAVTSGLGYAVWFAALQGLSAVRAATLQLAVPVLATGGGVALLAESVSLRLAVATVAILGGVGVAIVAGRVRDRSPAARVAEGDRRALRSAHRPEPPTLDATSPLEQCRPS